MKRGILFLFGCLLLTNSHLFSQDYIYSLNQFTPLIYQPASVAVDNEASISFLNRKTNIGPGINYINNAVNGEYPFVNKESGRRFAGIGLHFLQKDAGTSDLLESVTMGLSFAYNLPVAHSQFVSFGLQSVYNNVKTDLSSLTSGSQWLAAEFRFDPTAPLGEPITESRLNYFSFNGGAMWYLVDKETQAHRAFIGLSAFNLNRPNLSFFEGDSKLPVGFMMNTGGILYQKANYQLTPQLFYQYDNYAHITNLIISNKILFTNNNPYDIIQSGNVELLARYDFKKDFAMGVVFHQPGVSFGFNYNMPLVTSNEGQYFRNAFEFGIKLTKLVWKSQPKKITIPTSTPKRNFNFDEQGTSRTQQQTEVVSETDIIQKNIENYSKVTSVQFELDKNFKFEFGRTELNAEAKAYLDELYLLMQKNPEYKLEVIGHTDNVGKHIVNYKLSAARAQAVQDYLKQKGLSADRIRSKGMGDTHPVAPNDSEENRARNRRVQFIIYVNR